LKATLTALNDGGINFQSDINKCHYAFLLAYADDMVLMRPLDERVGEAVRSLWHDPCMDAVRPAPHVFGLTNSEIQYVP
jgi:hypothetical protein